MHDDKMSADEATETLNLERRIRREAERCAQALKLIGCGELRFVPEDMGSSALLACFLLELEKQCAAIGTAARVVFCFYPCEPSSRATADEQPQNSGDAIH
jgi:hypothetical protein